MNRYILLFLITVSSALFTTNAVAQVADFGKSFVNISKSVNGGTVEPGDTLEMRASFVVRSGTYDSCAYFDVVPAGTAYIPGTIRVLTNEGKIYKQFTDAANDDQGSIVGSNVKIYLGYKVGDAPSTAFVRGRIRNTHKPSFFGSACIMIASFRVRVTAALGTTINCGAGSMSYRLGVAPVQTINFPPYYVAIYTNFGMCANTVGTNSIGTEFNGTFGTGKPRNRGTSANVPPSYTYFVFDANSPNDYAYCISNNTSTRLGYTTSNAWAIPDGSSPSHRVFGVWDILGDHTGAPIPTAGNPPADTVANNNAGYMLVVNASYRIDSAFQQTITNLCPNTYYEISFWMRNICSRCGCDSNGSGASNAGYIPTAPNDSSGVYPNVNFKVNDVSYYGTGYIKHDGKWVKKGFTYKTDTSQTSIVLKIFNNASGGGGNDWALDDISVFTCNPDIVFSPDTITVCQNNTVGFAGTVTSLFNNYTYWRWEKSTTGPGGPWIPDTTGTSTPVWNGSQYVYTVTHNPIFVTAADSGTRYRLVLATTFSNLSNTNCIYNGSGNQVLIIVKTTGACMLLPVNFLSFSANKSNDAINLQWNTANEEDGLTYIIERSPDGMNFNAMGSKDGTGSQEAHYFFHDYAPMQGMNYYRLKAVANASGRIIYSRIIVINMSGNRFVVTQVINPFRETLSANVSSTENGIMNIYISGMDGRVRKFIQQNITSGLNQVSIHELDDIPPGIYILRMEMNGILDIKKIVKTK